LYLKVNRKRKRGELILSNQALIRDIWEYVQQVYSGQGELIKPLALQDEQKIQVQEAVKQPKYSEDIQLSELAYSPIYNSRDYEPINDEILAFLKQELGISFSRKVRTLLTLKALTPPEVYNAVDMDRRLFSKIMHDDLYQPTKTTVIKIALGMQLDLEETVELLNSAGYTLSHSIIFDIIVEYCLKNKRYDIYFLEEMYQEFSKAR